MSTVARCLRRPPQSACWRAWQSQPLSLALCRPVLSNITQPSILIRRSLQTSPSRRNDTPLLEKNTAKASLDTRAALKDEPVYIGPLAQTFRRLKIFSLSSLALTYAMTPLIFIIETASAVPFVGRVALAGTVLATSTISTALVSWCGKPYVTTLRWLPPENPAAADADKQATGIELTTLSLTLQERITRVYDTAFLVPTNRPLAKWELAEAFKLSPAETEAEKKKNTLPREETIAETMDKDGKVLGRWVVKWDVDGSGTCHEVGKINRYFNVHEETLEGPIKWTS